MTRLLLWLLSALVTVASVIAGIALAFVIFLLYLFLIGVPFA